MLKNDWKTYWQETDKSPLERLVQKYKVKYGYKKLLNGVPSIKSNGSVLEVGAGRAYLSRLLRNRGWQTTAIDIDSDVVKENSQVVDKYLIADMYDLPFNNNTFDMVISCGLIEHFTLDEIKCIVQEMSRVGRSVVTWFPTCDWAWKLIWFFRNIFGGKIVIHSHQHQIKKIKEVFSDSNLINIKAGYVRFAVFFRYTYVFGEQK